MAVGKLDTEGKWMVGETEIYIPSISVKVDHTNVVGAESGRTEDGYNHIDWVRRDVRKVYLTYSALTGNELAFLVSTMQGKEFTFTYYDMGQVQTFYGYVGEMHYTQLTYGGSEYSTEGGLYVDISVNVIEI